MPIRSDLRLGAITVYGSPVCSWTRKQIASLENKGMAYSFVNCDTMRCPDFVEAYPTMDKNGSIQVGFTEL
jgi:hypothetical protein